MLCEDSQFFKQLFTQQTFIHDGCVGIPEHIPQHQWIVCDSWTPLTSAYLLVSTGLCLNYVEAISNDRIYTHLMEIVIPYQILSPAVDIRH